MSRGSADYGNSNLPVSLSDVSQNAIMTALLGFSPIDYRGQAVFINTFKQGGEGWSPAASGGGTLPKLVQYSNPIWSSPVTYELRSSVVNGSSRIGKQFMVSGMKSIGFEIGACVVSNSGTIDITIQYNMPNYKLLTMGVRYINKTGQFYYYTQGLGYSLLSGITLAANTNGGWLQFKMSYDFELKQYKRLVFAGESIDMQGLTCREDNLVNPGSCYMQINSSHYDATSIEKVWVGYAIITRDEQ